MLYDGFHSKPLIRVSFAETAPAVRMLLMLDNNLVNVTFDYNTRTAYSSTNGLTMTARLPDTPNAQVIVTSNAFESPLLSNGEGVRSPGFTLRDHSTTGAGRMIMRTIVPAAHSDRMLKVCTANVKPACGDYWVSAFKVLVPLGHLMYHQSHHGQTL